MRRFFPKDCWVVLTSLLAMSSSAVYGNDTPAAGTSAANTQASGTQLACGYGPNRQTSVYGNNFYKISGNGIFMYDTSTKQTAEALVSATRGGGKPLLEVPSSGISDIAYEKYNPSKGGWLDCPLDSVKGDVTLLNKLLQTSTEDDRCTPVAKVHMTYTGDPNHPDPTKDNKVTANLSLHTDGTAEVVPCGASDPSCPIKPESSDPKSINFKVGSDGKVSATLKCSDSSGNVVAQNFTQNIGGGTGSSVGTPIDAGKTQ